MSAVAEVDELIERYHLALGEFMKGDPEPAKRLWSHRGDATLTNPQGSAVRGWDEIAEAMEHAASTRRDGRFLGFETWRNTRPPILPTSWSTPATRTRST